MAKLWQKKAAEAAAYHNGYYLQKYQNVSNMKLEDVYIDITGSKQIARRPAMLRLMRDCQNGRVTVIATQTKAYLAANTEEFFFLIYYLFSLPQRIDIVTEDVEYNINTIINTDYQREALILAANKYVAIETERFQEWISEINKKMDKLS